MNVPLIECVPNFSEGRRADVIEQIAAAIRSVPGALLLDIHRDADHNRSVITFAGAPSAVLQAAFGAVAAAQRVIDLDQHHGTHPRIGAADVVPFVPLRGATMRQCVALARQLAQQIAAELGTAVYLYERAATRPDRRNLANIRGGGYEQLRDLIRTDPARAPDFGPAVLTGAGATVVGARDLLIAYNVFLDTDDVTVARRIATQIRERDGGLAHVKALGMLVGGRAQVSMNLTDFRRTSPQTVWARIAVLAAQHNAAPVEPEIVGLIPRAALPPLDRYPQFAHIAQTQVLEDRLAQRMKAENV